MYAAPEGLAPFAGELMLAGYLLEVIGLAVAAHGLLQTWQVNRDGRSFLAGMPKVLQLRQWVVRQWHRIFTPRPEPIDASVSPATVQVTSAVETPWTHVDDEPTLEDRIKALEVAHGQVLAETRQTAARLEEEGRERRNEVAQLNDRVEVVEHKARAYTRRSLVEGIPIAILGLALAGLGLILQGIGTWVTWPCA